MSIATTHHRLFRLSVPRKIRGKQCERTGGGAGGGCREKKGGEGKGRRKKKHRQITGCFACSSVCLLACPIGETKHRLRQVIGPTLNRSKQKTTHVPLPPLPPASARATSPPCPRSRPFSEAFQQRPALAHSPPLRSRLH